MTFTTCIGDHLLKNFGSGVMSKKNKNKFFYKRLIFLKSFLPITF